MAVITISRQVGSLGTEIAQEVAAKLGYEYLDREGIEQGLTAHGLAVPEVEKFDEKSQPFWINWQIQARKFLHAMQTVIFEAARRDNVVIVGRGGQVLLKGLPGVLHVRLVAPFSERVKRLVARDGGDEKELSRILKQSDRDSDGFIRTFFDADWEDKDLYDLTINTRRLPLDAAVDMVLRAIPAIEASKDTKKFRERLDDLILQQKVESILLKANLRNFRIEVTGGVVTLHGRVFSSLESSHYVRKISGIQGVHKVVSNMSVHMPIGT